VKRWALLLAIIVSACGPTSLFHRGPRPDANVEAQFTRALELFGPTANIGALDTATALLDAYLAHGGHVARRPEAVALRRLAGDAMQLLRVASALQQERTDNRTKTGETAPARQDNDSLKEIQRLKDELAAANAELERIKKRLATQKP
jgi:hypothetical protein